MLIKKCFVCDFAAELMFYFIDDCSLLVLFIWKVKIYLNCKLKYASGHKGVKNFCRSKTFISISMKTKI